jgi:hypothetical protein
MPVHKGMYRIISFFDWFQLWLYSTCYYHFLRYFMWQWCYDTIVKYLSIMIYAAHVMIMVKRICSIWNLIQWNAYRNQNFGGLRIQRIRFSKFWFQSFKTIETNIQNGRHWQYYTVFFVFVCKFSYSSQNRIKQATIDDIWIGFSQGSSDL